MIKKDYKHLEQFKVKLHSAAYNFYGYDPFINSKQIPYVKIRQCIAYVLNTYNGTYSMTDIGYLIGAKSGKKAARDHATALHAIKIIKFQHTNYEDISSLLSEAYQIVGSAINGTEQRINKSREIMARIDDNIKFTPDQQYHWNLMKCAVIESFKKELL